MINCESVKVDLLGGFSVSRGNTDFFNDIKIKNNKPLQLLVFLLCQPDQKVVRDYLIASDLIDTSNENPKAVYKNVVYRLRKQLKSCGFCGEPDEVITFNDNIYQLNIPFETDISKLMKYLEKIKQTSDRDKIWEFCLKATELYRDEFLGGVVKEKWACEQAEKLKSVYLEILDIMWHFLQRNCRYEEAVPTFERAFSIYPMEERVYLRYIELLFRSQEDIKALGVYESICKLLFDELGISAPKPLLKLMGSYFKNSDAVALHINEVVDNLTGKRNDQKGALECTFQEFASIHERFARSTKRSGKEVFLMLVTLWEADGSLPAAGARRRTLLETLQDTIMQSLRAEDVFSRYSSSQYVLMLTDLQSEHCEMIANRIKSSFSSIRGMNKLRLDIKFVLASQLESGM